MKDTNPDRNCSFFFKHLNYECDINEFNFLVKTNMFTIIHTNIRSHSKNHINLSMFLRLKRRELLCISGNETWLNIYLPISMISIPNYSSIHKSHNSSRGGGGVGIYIHNSNKFRERNNLTIFADGITVFVKIENN